MNVITKLRKKNGLSQEALATLLGVTQSAVSQWEKGRTRPDLKAAQDLAMFFGITVDDLIEPADNSPLNLPGQIRVNCGCLNDEALQKILDYTEDLIATGKYTKSFNIKDSE